MNAGYVMLITICVIAIIVLMMNICVVSQKHGILLKVVCITLFAFSMLRYCTLIVYGDSPTLSQLEALRYFYLATSIGLTVPTAAAVWYISPYIREKLSYGKYLLLWIPWIVFYLYVIITQPTEIVQGKSFGYALELTGRFSLYLSIAQGTFVTIIIILCVVGIAKYRNEFLRSKYVILILAQILLTLDGLSYYLPVLDVFPPFTVTEVFGFLAVLYAFYMKTNSKIKL